MHLRFPGQYFDEETGLYYNYFRDYDPVTGRYVESDPIGLEGGVNTYAYAGQNPSLYVDRLGLFVTSVDAACAIDPEFCAEIVGQLVENAGALTNDECVQQKTQDIANDIRLAGVLATIPSAVKLARSIIKAPQAARTLVSRSAAFRRAKELGGIPRSAQPAFVRMERLRDQPGNVQSRVYEFVGNDGRRVTVREHSMGHAQGGIGPHFNVDVRPAGGGPRLPLQGGADDHVFFGGRQ